MINSGEEEQGLMKELFEQNIGKVAAVRVPHGEPLKGTVGVPHDDYLVMQVGETKHFVAYQHVISVFFHEATPLRLPREFEVEQVSMT